MIHFHRVIAVCAALVVPAAMAAPNATSFSEKDDPQRWYRPLETPRQRYDNAILEARNALAEAIRACKSSDDRRACEAAARAQHRREVTNARALLAPARQLG